jgi:hypothetical protein
MIRPEAAEKRRDPLDRLGEHAGHASTGSLDLLLFKTSV